MKLIASGDHHWTERARLDECRRVHDWMVDLVQRERPDLFISTGDIYDEESTPRTRELVADWLVAIADVCTVLVVKGNHDYELDCVIMARLRSKHPIYVEEAASCRVIAGLGIATVAWPERARLVAQARVTNTTPDLLASDALRNVFRGLGDQLAGWDGPRLAAGHFMVDGSITSTGQPLLGQPLNVSLTDLSLLNAQLVLMGHIHKPQEFLHGSTPMLYTGSPYRTAFGELEQKSVVIAEFDDKELVSYRRVPTPCAPMLLITESWDVDDDIGGFGATAEAHCELEEILGAEIRLRYEVDCDQRAAAAICADQWKQELLAAGAVNVKVEECVRTSTHARAPEVAAARTLADKLIALWALRDCTPEPERVARLLDKAQQVEAEATAP